MTMPTENTEPTIQQQIVELEAAGWRKVRNSIWKSPAGKLHLGPYGAWKIMKAAKKGLPTENTGSAAVEPSAEAMKAAIQFLKNWTMGFHEDDPQVEQLARIIDAAHADLRQRVADLEAAIGRLREAHDRQDEYEYDRAITELFALLPEQRGGEEARP